MNTKSMDTESLVMAREKKDLSANAESVALQTMDAEALRTLIRDMIPLLEPSMQRRFRNYLIERAARLPGWVPAASSEHLVSDVLTFVDAAKKRGYADPDDVDGYLQQGANAFLSKDYAAAMTIFRSLLLPIAEMAFELGQHEMVDEVLGVDTAVCADQYVVSAYMTATPDTRAGAVWDALRTMSDFGFFRKPLARMEQVAVESLPDFSEFLVEWRAVIISRSPERQQDRGDTNEDRWLREVVRRLEGSNGLAQIARSTKRADDLRAWCDSLVEANDWKAALVAYKESAKVTRDESFWKGRFLDGAALAAQALGRKNVPTYLEKAWREAPDMVRLLRWLGSTHTQRTLRKRAADALEACPKDERRQRALLYVLVGNWKGAARLLSAAPGLGWSSEAHPGHLLFPVLFLLLRGGVMRGEYMSLDASIHGAHVAQLEHVSAERNQVGLMTPTFDAIFELAELELLDDASRHAVARAMRKSATKRVDGVTQNGRRRHYGHAAELVALCAATDTDGKARKWTENIRDQYRRHYAFQRELDDQLGPRPT